MRWTDDGVDAEADKGGAKYKGGGIGEEREEKGGW